MMLIVIWQSFCLSCNLCSHSPRRSDSQNKIHMNRVNNDYVYQSANTIYCKHNIYSLLWWLERWHWENMCLLVQNMKLNIPTNGGDSFWIASCLAMCSTPWTHQSRFILLGSMAWLHMHWKRPWVVGWGKFSLVCSAKDKMLEAFLKSAMAKWAES